MPGEIIESAFLEWTTGLPLHDQLISIFIHIRDIPYALVPSLGNQMSGPEQLLFTGMGSCGPKHQLLGTMFTWLRIPIRYQIWPFLWNDPELLFPPDLRASTTRLGITNHLACQAFLSEKWVLVDATWDLPLEKGGFPVNQSWDGISDTLLAVHPVNRKDPPVVNYNPILRSRTGDLGKAGHGEFVDLFNAWLEQIRHRS